MILLLVFLCLLILLIFHSIFPLILIHYLNLFCLRVGTRVDLDFCFLFGIPVGVEVGGVVLRVLVESHDEVVGVEGLVELRCRIDTRIHLLLSVVYQRLNLLLSIAFAIELILKETLHLEV
jgi:hypothetical protein